MGRINHGIIQLGQILKSLIRENHWGSHLAGFKFGSMAVESKVDLNLTHQVAKKSLNQNKIISRNSC